ncbi:MAG: hypothetical protein IOD12_11150 [Silvanigrellales bacterium]|nr:hypothetical protein [Silvanigrellales bacterium]
MSTWHRNVKASLYVGLLTLCASFSTATAASPSSNPTTPRSHPGFGRHREVVSVHSGSNRDASKARQGLRARAANSFRGKGKKTTICKETASEFVCTTSTTY